MMFFQTALSTPRKHSSDDGASLIGCSRMGICGGWPVRGRRLPSSATPADATVTPRLHSLWRSAVRPLAAPGPMAPKAVAPEQAPPLAAVAVAPPAPLWWTGFDWVIVPIAAASPRRTQENLDLGQAVERDEPRDNAPEATCTQEAHDERPQDSPNMEKSALLTLAEALRAKLPARKEMPGASRSSTASTEDLEGPSVLVRTTADGLAVSRSASSADVPRAVGA
mmetsp:Transcript_2775/g.7824  ORF Transcript_2775/g.7824 Transcript_2775/m.7824 type:complete len:224 (+) Transcript_2775:57-728(+)